MTVSARARSRASHHGSSPASSGAIRIGPTVRAEPGPVAAEAATGRGAGDRNQSDAVAL